ncbi:FHA domain-containing protein [Mycetocola tolaasinivorans]|nr:FHA domain-containing protein [Mycetocola tolaasinivorans]
MRSPQRDARALAAADTAAQQHARGASSRSALGDRHMTLMRLGREEPAELHLHRDHTGAEAFLLSSRDASTIQIGVGEALIIRILDASGNRYERTADDDLPALFRDVLSVEILRADPATPNPVTTPADDTVLRAAVTTPADDTVLCFPAPPASEDPDATVLGSRFWAAGVVVREESRGVTRVAAPPASTAPRQSSVIVPDEATILRPRAGTAEPSAVTPSPVPVSMPGEDEPGFTDTLAARELTLTVDSAGQRQRFHFAETAIIGRAPSRPRDPALRDAVLVSVAARSMGISANHVRLRREGPHVMVRDLGTGNGTRIVPVLGDPYRLRGDEEIPLPAGARVDLGEDTTLWIGADANGA